VQNVSLRKFKKEDAEDIYRIQAAITQGTVQADFIQTIEDQAVREESASFVAELEGKIVGYIVSYILSGGFGISKSAWIAMLGVNPKLMGAGIGDRMAREILKYYRENGIREIYTSVRWDSADLLSFFKTLGFDRSDFIKLHKELE